MRVLNPFARPLVAVDTGTAMTRVCSVSSPVIEEPSTAAERSRGGIVRRPALRGGAVCDIAAAAQVLAPSIRRVSGSFRRPAALVCAPSDASPEERDALVEAVNVAGASVTCVVAEPLAAAIGAGMDGASGYAQLIADIGEGVTDVAVVAGGGLVRSQAQRTGCGDIRQALADWLEWHQDLVVDRHSADSLIRAFCSHESMRELHVAGRGTNGAPLTRILARDELAEVIEPALETISGFIGRVFRDLPDVLAAQVIESGIHITGGGATLELLAGQIEISTGLNVVRPADPLRSVIRGARAMLRSGLVPRQPAL